jgi:hypothetical protein
MEIILIYSENDKKTKNIEAKVQIFSKLKHMMVHIEAKGIVMAE